jgi:hypothetical protein
MNDGGMEMSDVVKKEEREESGVKGKGKGYQKALEFRAYLDGGRSARDPRFDLKVFQYVPLSLRLSSPLLLFCLDEYDHDQDYL